MSVGYFKFPDRVPGWETGKFLLKHLILKLFLFYVKLYDC